METWTTKPEGLVLERNALRFSEQNCKIKKEKELNKDNTLELKTLIIDLQKQMNDLINKQKPIISNSNNNNNNLNYLYIYI